MQKLSEIIISAQCIKEMHMSMPAIIQSPAKEKMSEKKVMEGIVNSAMLTPTQRGDIDGLVKSGMPEGRRRREYSGTAVALASVKPSATKGDIGARHYPGSPYR
jgi:hypothetical protein